MGTLRSRPVGTLRLNTRRRRGRAEALRGHRPRCRAGRDRSRPSSQSRSSSTGGSIPAARATCPNAARVAARTSSPEPGWTRPERSASRIRTLSAHTSQLSGSWTRASRAGRKPSRTGTTSWPAGRRKPRSAPAARAARRCRRDGRRRRQQRLRLSPVVALQPGGQVAPQRRAALRVGHRLAADPKQLRDALGRHVAQASGAQQAALAPRRLEPHGPEQRAALERPLPADQITATVAGPVVDRAEEDRRVRVGDMGEARRLVVDRELSHPLGHALDRLGVHLAGRHRASATAIATASGTPRRLREAGA